MMTGFASPGRLRLQVFSTSWRLDPPRACRPCFVPDPLMGLHPPELSSSRAAVRRLRRLSPHVVGNNRRACLVGELRRAPNPNAETMEPVVQRRTPKRHASLPKQRDLPPNARWKSRTPFAVAETPAPVIRHPNAVSRVPIPKHRGALSSARRAPASEVRYRSNVSRLPTPAPASHPGTRRRNAETIAGRHPIPSTESPAPKRRAPAEAPTPKRRDPFAPAPPKRRESSGHATPRCHAFTAPAPPKRCEPAVRGPEFTGSNKPAEASPPSGVCSARESATPRRLFRPPEARSSPGLSSLQGSPLRDNGSTFTEPPLMGFLSSDASGR
jgi:hypothetical protein